MAQGHSVSTGVSKQWCYLPCRLPCPLGLPGLISVAPHYLRTGWKHA